MEQPGDKTVKMISLVFRILSILVAVIVTSFLFLKTDTPAKSEPITIPFPVVPDDSYKYTIGSNPIITISLPQNYVATTKDVPLDNSLSERLFSATSSDTLFMIRRLSASTDTDTSQKEVVDELYTLMLDEYNKNPVQGDTTSGIPIKKFLGGNYFVYHKSVRTRVVDGVEQKENIDQYITHYNDRGYYLDFDDVHSYPNNENVDDAIVSTFRFN